MRQTITIIWNDGTEEHLSNDGFYCRDGMIVICLNSVTRSYRSIPLTSIKEYRTKG